MNELSLFTGAGGGILGSKLIGWRVVCAVENDAYARAVLASRQNDKTLKAFPIWDDVCTFDGKPWRGIVDVVSAGFPCQPFSVAGKQEGEFDKRNLWPETIRIIREIRPKFILLENVSAILANKYMGQIFGDLASSGYDCRWDCIPASSVSAPHQRDRLWIVAYNDGEKEFMANSHSLRELQSQRDECDQWKWASNCSWWKTEPEVGRVVDGIPYRVDQLRCLGNGQVPEVVRKAWLNLI